MAIAVMTTANAQIPEPETEEKIYTVETGSQQTIAPVADEQTQAEELINSCIDPSLDCSFAAAPLKSDSISVALTLMGPAADSSVASIADANVPMALYADDEEDEEFVEDDEGTSGSDSEKSEDEFDDETLTTNDSPETINTENTFEIVTTTAGNPSFTIQYYANLSKVQEFSESEAGEDSQTINGNDARKKGYLPVIDTRREKGGKLPDSSTKIPDKKAYLKVDANNKKVATETAETQIYKDEPSKLYERPNLTYFSPGTEVEKGYRLVQIKVWPKGADTKTEQPTCYPNTPLPKDAEKFEKIYHITNRSDLTDQEDKKYIYIADGDIVRLIYEPRSRDLPVSAHFHDYDISDGTHEKFDPENPKVVTMITNKDDKAQGINNPGNYDGSGVHYAFGNGNAGTGLDTEKINGNIINKLNAESTGGKNVYDGCSFGLVTGLTDAGLPVFATGISAPRNLFTNDTGNGATYHSGGLTFERVGDTYTLTTAKVGEKEVCNLNQLEHPICNQTTHTHIWTNNFWPMDDEQGKDIHFGAHRFNNSHKDGSGAQDYQTFRDSKNRNEYLPLSDNGKDHNSYFGMNFTVNFELNENYVGPLQYLFFGDDDMWVFLEDPDGETQLVCDLGGVHRTMGEIVNLWDYIPEVSEGTYTLHFFFTERGASGSTCWMQFTLPSVYANEPEPSGNYGSLRFKKDVENKIMPEGKVGEDNTDETFLFTISLTDEEGRPLSNGYKYIKYNSDVEKDENVVKVYVYHDNGEYTEYENALIPDLSQTEQEAALGDGVCFTLKKGQHILVPSLPKGTKFTIKEVGVLIGDEVPRVNPVWGEGENGKSAWRYRLKADGEADHQYEYFVGEGKCENGEYSDEIAGEDANVSVNFSNTYYSYELPKTGGAGTWGLTGAGLLLMLAAGCLLVRKRA